MAVATAVSNWLVGKTIGDAASNDEESRQITAFASAFRSSPELVRLHLS
jgi:hypothetical protein